MELAIILLTTLTLIGFIAQARINYSFVKSINKAIALSTMHTLGMSLLMNKDNSKENK